MVWMLGSPLPWNRNAVSRTLSLKQAEAGKTTTELSVFCDYNAIAAKTMTKPRGISPE